MKKRILFLCLLGGLGATAQAQSGIIGINTENPKGVLHIDGASMPPATTNPQTGDVSPAQAVDDVIVDAQGRIGIGHLSPEAQIDIHSDTPGAIRIQDGTEGEGKLLFSDANGLGAWGPGLTENWYAALYDGPLLAFTTSLSIRALNNYTGSLIAPEGGGSVNAAAGSITLPKAGTYRITISIYWECNRTAPYLARAILRVGGSSHKTFSNWGGNTSYSVLPTFVGILELGAGNVLTLATDETGSNHANRAQAVLFMVELLR
jgi:hypothetical protein